MIYMKKTKPVAICGLLAAMSLALMFLGSVLWVFTYVAPLMCSLIIAIICDVAGKKYALITFVAISVISVFFLPDKECALTYAFFFGYYTIIKDSLEKIKPKLFSFLVKLLIFNAGVVSSQALLIYAFGIPLDNPWGKFGIVILMALANAVFVAYELMLSRLMMLYEVKYKSKVHKLLK